MCTGDRRYPWNDRSNDAGGDAQSDCGTVTAGDQSGGDAFCRPSLRVRNWCNCGKYAACSIAWSIFFRCACTYIYHEKSGKFKHYKITFSGNGNEHLFYGTHFGGGPFVESVTDGWILGIRRISRGNVAGCKNYFSGRDTGISGSSAPCTEN